MVEIKGELKCMNESCGWSEEDVKTIFQCPSCEGQNVNHSPPHKIYICENQNPQGFGRNGGQLSNIHKKIRDNQRGKGDLFKQILQMVISDRRVWTSTQIINKFKVGSFTDGDVIRRMLDLLVCQGYLEKIFMKGNYHEYNSDVNFNPCPHLNFFQKGKKIGIRKCTFDFKLNGKELDSKEVFKV